MGCCKTRDVGNRQKEPMVEKETRAEVGEGKGAGIFKVPVLKIPAKRESVKEEIPHQTHVSPLELALKLFHQEEEQRGTFGPPRDPLISPRQIISTVRSAHSTRNSLLLNADEEETVHGVPLSLLNLEFSDPEFREIEVYARGLLKDTRWKAEKTNEHMELKSIASSKFSNESPMYMCSMAFPECIPADLLLDCVDDWEVRGQWDSRVVKMKKLYSEIGNFFTHYHILRLDPLLDSRSFLVKFALRSSSSSSTIVVFKSVATTVKVEENLDIARGKVQFGYIHIESTEKETQLKAVVQFLLYMEETGGEEEVPGAVFAWLEEYRENAIRIYREEMQRMTKE